MGRPRRRLTETTTRIDNPLAHADRVGGFSPRRRCGCVAEVADASPIHWRCIDDAARSFDLMDSDFI
eukprot:5596315-Pyramimonas_sp.AAC.1